MFPRKLNLEFIFIFNHDFYQFLLTFYYQNENCIEIIRYKKNCYNILNKCLSNRYLLY
jgi:hypothetical protein